MFILRMCLLILMCLVFVLFRLIFLICFRRRLILYFIISLSVVFLILLII